MKEKEATARLWLSQTHCGSLRSLLAKLKVMSFENSYFNSRDFHAKYKK